MEGKPEAHEKRHCMRGLRCKNYYSHGLEWKWCFLRRRTSAARQRHDSLFFVVWLSTELIESRNLHNLMKYADSNGNISLEYFTMAMNELGVHNADVVQSFFRTMDTDGNGSVSFEEFVAGIAAIGSDTAEPLSRLKFVFQSCDLNGNGVVQKEELRYTRVWHT